MINKDFIVVDDFVEAIEHVVDSAKAPGFGRFSPNKGQVGSSIYDGMGFFGDHALLIRSLMLNTGGVVVPKTMFFRSTNVDTETAYIHSDREMGSFTCVAYLSEHEEEYGTAFFRHKPTGLTEMPSFQEMRNTKLIEELKKDMVSRDPDKWEQTDYVEGKYNRALIFRAPLFHSRYPATGIGTDPDEGRLVWVSHFYELGEDGLLY